jgi:hypothetical protein
VSRQLVLAALLVFVACAGTTLPEGARPSGEVREGTGEELVTGDRIRYRTLTRADFKAAEPPPRIASFSAQIGAATCSELVPAENMEVIVRQTSETRYEARFDGLGFVALMNRECSWWNPEKRAPEAYVLQHEQIHFALFELAARDLNAAVPQLSERLRGRGRTAQAAADDLSEQLFRKLQEVLEEVQARNTRFDEETSLSLHVEEQARWAREIEAELAR